MARSGPERMCVSSRSREAPDSMIRLVRHPVTGVIVVDLPGKLPGRGAWVLPHRVSDLKKKPGKLTRALGAEVDTSELDTLVRDAIVRAILDGISMAAASGSLVGGHDRLAHELRQGGLSAVIVASDASSRTVASLERALDEENRVAFVKVPLGRDALGERTGRGPRAALGVRSTRGAAFLRRQLRRLRDLG